MHSFRNFISKLPDKGEKIASFRDKLLKELEHRNEVERAANLLSQLNIASIGKAAMTKLEWTGKYNNKNEDTTKIVELDSDDEEDPLKILAQVGYTLKETLIIIFVYNYNNNCLCSNSLQELVFTRKKLYM